MKTTCALFAFLSFAFFAGCNDDDHLNTKQLDGVWKLHTILAEDAPEVTFGKVRYDFAIDSNTLTVIDNSTGAVSPIAAGTYEFTYEAPTEEDEVGALNVDGITYNVTFEANGLILAPIGSGNPLLCYR